MPTVKADDNVKVRRMVWLGIFVISVVVLATYFPATKATLYMDDWWYLEWAGRLSLRDFIAITLDPRIQEMHYRPIQGIFFLIAYTLFHSNLAGYHLIQILVHLANCLLLFGVVSRVSRDWRIGLVSAVLYAGLPAYGWAVDWLAVADPLATFFYLVALLSHTVFLQTMPSHRFLPFLTLGAFVLALFTKEIGVFLPLFLFLLEYWLIGVRGARAELVKRYAPFLIVLIPYALLLHFIQTQKWFVTGLGYSLGPHIVKNLVDYLAILALPWGLDIELPLRYLALIISAVLLIRLLLNKKNLCVSFLVVFAIINIMPVTGFQQGLIFETRWLYLPAIAVAVILALIFEALWKRLPSRYVVLVSLGAAVLLFANGIGTANATAEFAEQARKARVPFRDIALRHPTFPENTYLYFLEPPSVIWMSQISGMSFLQYGKNVSVGHTHLGQMPEFRNNNVSYAYYFDETGRPVEVTVEKDASTQSSPPPPIDFVVPIRLEGYEVVRTTVKRGEALVLLIYWRATGRIDKDYTVFAHLVDPSGQIVAGFDSKPRDGKEQTSSWGVNQFIVDARVIPITDDVLPGDNYKLRIGLYYLPTLEHVGLTDASGHSPRDAFVIEPFSVLP